MCGYDQLTTTVESDLFESLEDCPLQEDVQMCIRFVKQQNRRWPSKQKCQQQQDLMESAASVGNIKAWPHASVGS